MLEKLKTLKNKYIELSNKLLDPDIFSDSKNYAKVAKEHSELEDIANLYDKLFTLTKNMEEAEALMKTETDKEMLDMLNDEIYSCKHKIEALNEEAKVLLLPKDENDDKNVIIEIRAGAGGDEAGIFGGNLMNMYIRYAEKNRLKVEMIDYSEGEMGGIKETTFMISGKNVYEKLKYESGVHRVQRVPETESQGRVHTSTATVAVLPEQPNVDIEINEKDLRIDTYRASGAGGQHVNKTESAIRLTHIPSGIVVACQEERSQIKNRERAFSILKSKLYDFYQGQKEKEYAENRRIQIGTGDRSEKIRTYNYPQGRVTDHRINYTIYSLENFMLGDIEELINELKIADQKAKLENL